MYSFVNHAAYIRTLFFIKIAQMTHLLIVFSLAVSCNSHTAELRKTKADHDAMKKQAEATSTEYDRLTSEFQKLQVMLIDT